MLYKANLNLAILIPLKPLFVGRHLFLRHPVNSAQMQFLIGWFTVRDAFAIISFVVFSNVDDIIL